MSTTSETFLSTEERSVGSVLASGYAIKIKFTMFFQGKRSKIPEKGQAFNRSPQGHCPGKGETIWSRLVIFAFEIMIDSV